MSRQQSCGIRGAPRCWLVLALGTGLCGLSAALDFKPCLPNPAVAKKVTFKGQELPLVVGAGNWDAPMILARIAQIILNEGIGVEADFDMVGAPYDLVRALMGCNKTTPDDPDCIEQKDWPRVHYDFENWYTEAGDLLLKKYPGKIKSGFIGYDGQEGLYMLEGIAQSVWENHKLPLEYYVTMSHPDRAWMENFTKPSEIEIPEDSGCRGETARLMEEQGMPCSADGWWYSPGCVDDPDTCIPVLMGGVGWLGLETCHVINYSRVPMAVTFLAWPDARLKDGSVNALFFWWRPDWSYNALGPVRRVLFPKHNRQEWAEGIFITDFPDFQLKKYMWAGVRDLSEEASVMFDNFEISWNLINEFMDQMYARSNASTSHIDHKFNVACEWVKANEATWRQWIAIDKTKCLVGQGLMMGDDGEEACQWCPPATFSDPHPTMEGSRLCVSCAEGAYQELPGQSSCTECETGHFASEQGLTACERCEIGKFASAEGASECTACSPDDQPSAEKLLTTAESAETSRTACVCKAGHYHPCAGEGCALTEQIASVGTSDFCQPCPQGMSCDGPEAHPHAMQATGANYHAEPQLQLGYWSTPQEPLVVYRCPGKGQFCKGGRPKSCEGGSRGLFCLECAEGLYLDNGQCAECSGWDSASSVLAIIVFPAIFMVFAYRSASKPSLMKMPAAQVASVCLSCALTAFQVLSIFGSTMVPWPATIRAFLNFFAIFALDLGSLRLSCVGFNTFIVQALVPYIMALIYGLLSLTPWISWSICMNAMGLAFQAFAITMFSQSLAPFYSYLHPMKERSMLGMPTVLIGSPEWSTMAALGILELLACCFAMAAIFYASMKIRGVVATPGKAPPRFASSLLTKFKPRAVLFCPMVVVRGLLLSLVPTLPVPTQVHVLLLTLILLGYLVLHCNELPFQQRLHNHVESVNLLILVLLVCGGAFYLEFYDEGAEEAVSGLLLAICIILCISIASALLYSMYVIAWEQGLGSKLSKESRAKMSDGSLKVLRLVLDTTNPIDCESLRKTLEADPAADVTECKDILQRGPLHYLAENMHPTSVEATRLLLEAKQAHQPSPKAKAGTAECVDPDAVKAALLSKNAPVLFEFYLFSEDIFGLMAMYADMPRTSLKRRNSQHRGWTESRTTGGVVEVLPAGSSHRVGFGRSNTAGSLREQEAERRPAPMRHLTRVLTNASAKSEGDLPWVWEMPQVERTMGLFVQRVQKSDTSQTGKIVRKGVASGLADPILEWAKGHGDLTGAHIKVTPDDFIEPLSQPCVKMIHIKLELFSEMLRDTARRLTVENADVERAIAEGKAYIADFNRLHLVNKEAMQQVKSFASVQRARYRGLYNACHYDLVKPEPGYEPLLRRAKDIMDSLPKQSAHVMQLTDNLIDLVVAGSVMQAEVVSFCRQCATETEVGEVPGHISSKGLFRIIQKLALGEVKAVRDVARCSIIYGSMSHMLEGLTWIARSSQVDIVRVKNRWAEPSSGGWADILLNVTFCGGTMANHICEIQLMHKHMLTVRKEMGGHDGYASFRAAEELLEVQELQAAAEAKAA